MEPMGSWERLGLGFTGIGFRALGVHGGALVTGVGLEGR